jgi:ADP-ribose pyrophosphatase
VEPAASRRAYRGSFVSVDVESWPGLPDHEIVRHPGAAGVLPVLPTGDVLLVRQFRPAIRDTLAEIPAGVLDVEGEDALTCAGRELFEETGYRHETIEFLGGYYSSVGFTDEYVHLFLARTAADPEGPPEDGIELRLEPFDRMAAAARAGRVRDVKTALALLLAAGRSPVIEPGPRPAPGGVPRG